VPPCYCCGTKAFGGQALPVLRYKQATASAGYCGSFAAGATVDAPPPGAGCVCIFGFRELPEFLSLAENFRVSGGSIYSSLMSESEDGGVV